MFTDTKTTYEVVNGEIIATEWVAHFSRYEPFSGIEMEKPELIDVDAYEYEVKPIPII